MQSFCGAPARRSFRFQRFARVHARRLQRGSKSKQNSNGEAGCQCKCHRHQPHFDWVGLWHRRWQRRLQRRYSAICNHTPKAPLTSESTRLSVSSCRASLPRPAPSAPRTAISCRRLVARASNKFATFAEAISKTSPTAPNMIHRWLLKSPTRSSLMGVTIASTFLLLSGNCFSNRSAIVRKSASAFDDGEPRTFRQHSRRILNVLYHILNPVHFTHVPALLFGLLDAPELDPCPPRCFVPGQPAAH